MNDFKFINGRVSVTAKATKVAVFAVSYENSSWKYVIASMMAYALQPVVLPIMIFLSKLLKRKIEWFPVDK